MGTPEFAVPTLDILVQAGYEVVGVVTIPDKPAGRGRKLRPSPVKSYAESKGLRVLQPNKLRDPDFIAELTELKPDLAVVVAFRMLPKVVWSIPSQGTFNLHASLLPDYRGAAPINWVLMNGETETGMTTFLIDEQIDTGNLLLQTKVDIPYSWTAGDLHDHLMEKGANLVLETVKGLEAGKLKPHEQDESLYIHKAPKIFKEDCQVDWSQPAEKLYHFIRGLSPYPAAWTTLEGQVLKLFRANVVELTTQESPGTIISNESVDSITIVCGHNALEIKSLQLAGKKRMPTADFLRGYKGALNRVD